MKRIFNDYYVNFIFQIEIKFNPKIFNYEKRKERIAKRLKYIRYKKV